MGHDWKPGTLAIVTLEDDHGPAGGPYLAFYSGLSRQWISAESGWINTTSFRLIVRPLVVIDPDDRESVARLNDLQDKHLRDFGAPGGDVDALAAALREFANPQPPKPDEPTGLGALVIRGDGMRWVRGDKGWTNLDARGPHLNWHTWEDINELSQVTEILWPGVQP